MKNKFIYLLLSLAVLLNVCVYPSAFASEIVNAVIFDESNFDYSEADPSGSGTSGNYYGNFKVEINSRGGAVTEGVEGKSEFDDTLVLTPKATSGGDSFSSVTYWLSRNGNAYFSDYSLEFDWYINAKPNSGASGAYQMVMYNTSGSYNRLITWGYSSGKKKVYVRAGHSTDIPSSDPDYFTKQTWYSMKMDFTKTDDGFSYDVYYKEKGAQSWEVIGENVLNNTKVTDIGRFAFWIPAINTNGSFLSLDNFSLTANIPNPELLSMGFDDTKEGTEVDVGAKTIRLNLSESIYDANAENVSVNQHGRDVLVSDATYNKDEKAVIITLGEALLPEREYEVILKKNTKITKWTEIGTDRSAHFTTTAEEVEIPEISLSVCDESDFEVSASGTATNGAEYQDTQNGFRGYHGAGYVDIKEIDSDHGTSLVLGVETINEAWATALPRYIYGEAGETNVTYDKLTVEFDAYISAKPVKTGENDSFRFVLFKSGGTTTAVSFNDKLVSGGNKVDYEAGTWQTIKVVAEKQSEGGFVYSTYLKNEEDVFVPLAENIAAAAGLDEIATIRFYAPISSDFSGEMAIDNIKISTQKDAPVISSFGYDDATEAEKISLDASVINVNLSDSILGIADGDIKLTQSGKPVLVEKVGYDSENNRILIVLAERLKEGTQYKVSLGENIEVFEGIITGVVQSKTFVTASNFVEVKEPYFKDEDGSLKVTADVTNSTNQAKTLYFAASVWNGDKFVCSKVSCITVSPMSTIEAGEFELSLDGVESGYTVEVYAWDNLLSNKLLTDRIWTYTK